MEEKEKIQKNKKNIDNRVMYIRRWISQANTPTVEEDVEKLPCLDRE